MTNDPRAGGDISSGFGESKVNGPVSDEKAQQMLHDGPPSGDAGQADSEYSEADRATNEQDLTLEQ
jgi:hypothetical protein